MLETQNFENLELKYEFVTEKALYLPHLSIYIAFY